MESEIIKIKFSEFSGTPEKGELVNLGTITNFAFFEASKLNKIEKDSIVELFYYDIPFIKVYKGHDVMTIIGISNV